MDAVINNFQFDFIQRAREIHNDDLKKLKDEVSKIILENDDNDIITLLISQKISEISSLISASLLNDYHDELIAYLKMETKFN